MEGEKGITFAVKMMNLGQELQWKQRVVFPTSASWIWTKHPEQEFSVSLTGNGEDSFVQKVKSCPSSYHTTICHVHLSSGSLKVVQQENFQPSVLNRDTMYIPHVK